MRAESRKGALRGAASGRPDIVDGKKDNEAVTDEQWPLFRHAVRVMVEVNIGESYGAGVILTEDGLILTAQHVVAGAKKITVRRFRLDRQSRRLVPLKRKRRAHVIFEDKKADIALVKIDRPGGRLPFAKLGDSTKLEVETPLYRVGRDDIPLGCGYVTSFGRCRGIKEVTVSMQADYGSSGGPVFDIKGRVVGIALRVNVDKKLPPSSYVIPIDAALRRLRKCEAWRDRPRRPGNQ